MKRIIMTTVVSLAMILAVTNAAAAIVSTSSTIEVIDPPPSVVPGALESNDYIRVFPEQRALWLSSAIMVDFAAPGTYDAPVDLPANPPAVQAGTWVNSYYLHSDQAGEGGSRLFKGTITFATPILGVMITSDRLLATNSLLGAATTTYPATGGLELSACTNAAAQDCVTLTAPATLTIKLTTWNVTDSLRVITQAVAPVTIDIKPGSDSNCVNNDGHGVIPVAILGSPVVDIASIDPASVRLEGVAVKVVGKSDRLLASSEDVNTDGFMDLVVQIQDVDGTFTPGSTHATLTGRFTDGSPFSGTDLICTVP